MTVNREVGGATAGEYADIIAVQRMRCDMDIGIKHGVRYK